MIEYIDPMKQAFTEFRGNNRDGPIHMLNLVRQREQHATQMDDQPLALRPMPPPVVRAGRCLSASAAELSGKASSN